LTDSPKEEEVIPDSEYEIEKPKDEIVRPSIKHGTGKAKYFIGLAVIIAAIALVLMINNMSTKESVENELPHEREMKVYPQELSGNYFARKIDGVANANATIKIYREGDGYGMNVYSSNITKKYIFIYNPSTGEIISDELGSGKARIKELTNETEITFTGWELLK
jgi:predicted small secreted protein